jgi:hypothetical protein
MKTRGKEQVVVTCHVAHQHCSGCNNITPLQGLAPADYCLFPKLKLPVKGRHFQTVENIRCAVTRELNNISKTALLEGMKKLKERANKCVLKNISKL